ncbi:chemotaxis-specific protein-glutamate methyltransferase CheB [Persephonella sp.]
MKKILVVDDSSFARKILSKIISDIGFDVDTASDGEEALKKIFSQNYDLITLDMEMPGISGIELLKQIMGKKPTRVIIISSFTTDNADLTFEALNLGALTYITKPGRLGVDLKKIEERIKTKIVEIINIPEDKILPARRSYHSELNKTYRSRYENNQKFIFIGASTGGPKHIEDLVKVLPFNYPHPVCIVQHMPSEFISKFVRRLDSISSIKVVEAKDGEVLEGGKVILGKGNYHLTFDKNAGNIVCRLKPDLDNSLFVPSIDKMFISALKVIEPEKIIGILLTGIGSDGAEGLLKMKKSGALTISESEETAIVYGMPKKAYEIGGVSKKLSFPQILNFLISIGDEKDVQKIQS